MDGSLFEIRLRDGWALLMLLGIGGMVAWHCQSESRFSFFLTVSASGSTNSEKQGDDDSRIESSKHGNPRIDQP